MSYRRGSCVARALSLLAASALLLTGCGGGDSGGDSTGAAHVGVRSFSMSTARAEHALTTLPNGDLLISGGVGTSGLPLASCDVVDASLATTGNPVVSTSSMAIPRARHTATLLASGKVVAIGGSGGAAIEEFTPNLATPSLGVWATSPTAALSTPRRRHTAVRLLDGRVLVAGGEDVGGTATASCELYIDSATPVAVAAPLNVARRDHTATLLADGRVLVAGGRDLAGAPLSSLETYNPVANTWTTLAATLSFARALHGAVLMNDANVDPTDDRVLLTGGFDAAGDGIRAAELFDPTTNTVAAGGLLEGPGVFDHATVELANGQAAVVGGFTDGGAVSPDEPVRETIVYRLGSGAGVGAQDLPGRRGALRAGVIASSGPAGSDVVATGGYGGDGVPRADVFFLPIDDEATALDDTLSDEEALALGTIAAAFHLFYDGLVGYGDVELAIEEDPVLGRTVRGWVGDFFVDLELDAGSVVGDVEGLEFVMTNVGGFLDAPDFDVDFRPAGYVDGDMDVADQDFDFFIDRGPGLFIGEIEGFDTDAHLRVDVVGDHTDVATSYLDLYWI